MRTDYTLICTPRPPSLDALPPPVQPAASLPRLTPLMAVVAVPIWTAILYGITDGQLGWTGATAIAIAGATILLRKRPA